MPTMSLKEARERRGIKKKSAAAALHVSRPTYDGYENDPSSMTVEQAKTICNFVGYSVEQIFFDTDVSETQHREG